VHDPDCALCRGLKRNTESALQERPNILYRIANLKSSKGRKLASQYGVGKVTLLLFNGDGEHVHTIQGVTPAEQLANSFDRFL